MTGPTDAEGLDYIAAVGVPEGFLDGLSDDQLFALRDEVAEGLAVRASAVRDIRATSFDIPVILGGGPTMRCGRCSRAFSAATYHVIENIEETATGLRYTHVCRRCADADPDLHVWSAHCDITDMIDEVMQAAGSPTTREMLANCISSTAKHFADWRWPPPVG